jgi:hypothetical protein
VENMTNTPSPPQLQAASHERLRTTGSAAELSVEFTLSQFQQYHQRQLRKQQAAMAGRLLRHAGLSAAVAPSPAHAVIATPPSLPPTPSPGAREEGREEGAGPGVVPPASRLVPSSSVFILQEDRWAASEGLSEMTNVATTAGTTTRVGEGVAGGAGLVQPPLLTMHETQIQMQKGRWEDNLVLPLQPQEPEKREGVALPEPSQPSQAMRASASCIPQKPATQHSLLRARHITHSNS